MFLLTACSLNRGGPAPIIGDVSVEDDGRGSILLVYTLANPADGPLDTSIFFQRTGDNWLPANSFPGSDSGTGMISNASLNEYSFYWDSISDVGEQNTSVKLRVVADNPYGRVSMDSRIFSVKNGNAPPRIAFVSITDNKEGHVDISLFAADEEDEPVSLFLEYSQDNGVRWQPASLTDNGDKLTAHPLGSLHQLTWLAGEDLEWNPQKNVRIRAKAADQFGPGEYQLSDRFTVEPQMEPELNFQTLSTTLRGVIPIVFSIHAPSSHRYTAKIEYQISADGTPKRCSPVSEARDLLHNLIGSPHGTNHEFIWDSLKDIHQDIVRDLKLNLTLSKVNAPTGEEELISQLTVDIDNAEIIAGPVIGEAYRGIVPNETRSSFIDGFIELIAPPGYDLEGLRLRRIWKDGSGKEEINKGFINLSGYIVDESGVFVVAGPDGPPADLSWEYFDTFFLDHPDAFSLILDFEDAEYTYDALGIGDFSGSAGSHGEGDPAPIPGDGKSLTRDLANTDMDDNAYDFLIANPTPGSAHFWPEW